MKSSISPMQSPRPHTWHFSVQPATQSGGTSNAKLVPIRCSASVRRTSPFVDAYHDKWNEPLGAISLKTPENRCQRDGQRCWQVELQRRPSVRLVSQESRKLFFNSVKESLAGLPFDVKGR